MEFENEILGASFSLPEKITVRQQLAYFSEAAAARGQVLFERLWLAARTVMQDWKCKALPDASVNLDDITDPKAAEVILWAGTEVKLYMDHLDDVPKNS